MERRICIGSTCKVYAWIIAFMLFQDNFYQQNNNKGNLNLIHLFNKLPACLFIYISRQISCASEYRGGCNCHISDTSEIDMILSKL